jgi:hypothetical protein
MPAPLRAFRIPGRENAGCALEHFMECARRLAADALRGGAHAIAEEHEAAAGQATQHADALRKIIGS